MKRNNNKTVPLGRRFGRWTILEDLGRIKQWHYVKCQCECGKIKPVIFGHITNGQSKSCGCLQKDKCRISAGGCGFTVVWNNTRAGAKRRNLEWSLTKEQLKNFHKQPCVYCGAVQVSCMAPGDNIEAKQWAAYHYNGIDRLDSTKGYFLENCVTCCIHCNRAKNSMSLENFLIWINRVYHHLTSSYKLMKKGGFNDSEARK